MILGVVASSRQAGPVASPQDVFPQDNAVAVSDNNSSGSWVSASGRVDFAIVASTVTGSSNALSITNNTGAVSCRGEMSITLEIGRVYNISVWARRITGTEQGFVAFEGFNNFTNQAITSTSWTEFTWTGLVANSSSGLIRAYPSSNGSNAALDDEIEIDLMKVELQELDYSITSMTYDSLSFNPADMTNLEQFDIVDGKLYISALSDCHRYTYTDDDVSASSDDGNDTTLLAQGRSGLNVRDQGNLVRYGNFGGTFYKRTMSTAYDLTTLSSATTESPTETDNERGWFMTADGTKVYVLDATNRTIYQYTCSPAFSGTLSYDSKSLDISGDVTTNIKGMCLSPDSKYCIVCDPNTDLVWQFEMSTPGDISTGGSGTSVSVNGTVNGLNGVQYNEAGDKIVFLDSAADTLYQYSL